MNLLLLLRQDGWTVPESPSGRRQTLVHKLLEVTPLGDAWAVEDLADRLPELFAAGGDQDAGRNRALHFAFGELCGNAISHGGGSPIYAAAQRYSGLSSGPPARLELAVADAGVGIPTHLRGNPRYADLQDRRAVALALKPGVTGTRDRRGYGFYDILRETGEVGEGEMVIYSGRAAAVIPFGQPGRRRRFSRLPQALPGA
ncbi:MAG: hypothetical protein ACRDJF_03515 [Actinomycetota bacterium]